MLSNSSYWLWYSGDFEIHQGMLQNFKREERGFGWPAYWHMDDCHRNVKFEKKYSLTQPTNFTVFGRGIGYVSVNNVKYPLNQNINTSVGDVTIEIYIGNPKGLPTIYVEGSIIHSNASWQCSNFIETKWAGFSSLFTKKIQNPNKIQYHIKEIIPTTTKVINHGILFDFGQVVNGTIKMTKSDSELPVTFCYGESETEALDVERCYYKQESITSRTKIRKRAFRYLYVPSISLGQIELKAFHEYIPKKNKAVFQSDNNTLNQIWQVATTTFDLCSDLFFIDGLKRDRWIWAGDAYQANFINQYSFFDEDIDKRTILALRGQNDLKQHLNTIVDYSMLWLISIEHHYQMTHDKHFLKEIYPKMVNLFTYLENQTDEHGFIYGRKNDWIFIDWADIDKTGTTSAEQILLIQVYRVMINCGHILKKGVTHYSHALEKLEKQVLHYFWDADRGAFIDSYVSNKHHVSRHPNILAILFNIVDSGKQQQILENVLLNPDIPQITTPYFKFFEQDALCKLGQQKLVYKELLSYWGGMLDNGAKTFWEAYNPKDAGTQHLSMYGDPYGKSLCHIWGASPIYLIGRYFIGLKPTQPGYREFTITPHLEEFKTLNCTLPIKDGHVVVEKNGPRLTVTATKPNGFVIWNGKRLPLSINVPLSITIN